MLLGKGQDHSILLPTGIQILNKVPPVGRGEVWITLQSMPQEILLNSRMLFLTDFSWRHSFSFGRSLEEVKDALASTRQHRDQPLVLAYVSGGVERALEGPPDSTGVIINRSCLVYLRILWWIQYLEEVGELSMHASKHAPLRTVILCPSRAPIINSWNARCSVLLRTYPSSAGKRYLHNINRGCNKRFLLNLLMVPLLPSAGYKRRR